MTSFTTPSYAVRLRAGWLEPMMLCCGLPGGRGTMCVVQSPVEVWGFKYGATLTGACSCYGRCQSQAYLSRLVCASLVFERLQRDQPSSSSSNGPLLSTRASLHSSRARWEIVAFADSVQSLYARTAFLYMLYRHSVERIALFICLNLTFTYRRYTYEHTVPSKCSCSS